ncbi:MAG TPA: enoyl-CoA hydratase/isomerase family protein [Sporichthya sp.]|nr:enoyl-CoA hydratase/isomerase family protein [Sporichthya sp.]
MPPETSAAPLTTPAGLAEGAAAHPLVAPDGSLVDPVLLVDRDAPDHPRALGAALASERILIGIASRAATGALAAALDFTLVPRDLVGTDRSNAGLSTTPTLVGVDDPHAAAAALAAAVHATPQAATVLVGLLRSEFPAARAALEAESLGYSTLLGGGEFRRWLDATARPGLPAAAADPVLVRREAGPFGEVLRVTLNRPERRNAYSSEMRSALVAALQVGRGLARADGLPGPSGTGFRIVLDGVGPSFCAGEELGEFSAAPDPVMAHLVRTSAGAAFPLLDLSDRIEARVHGRCVGAGVELAAFAGRVLAAPGTTFGLPEVGMGLIPGAGGTVSLPRRIGRWRTLYLALSGVELDLDTALAWRLVDGVSDWTG